MRARSLAAPGVLLLIGAAACLALLAPDEALARVGGGGSYSGGGGSSGGGGGGDGEVVFLLIRLLLELCWYHPTIGLPLLGIVVGYVIYQSRSEGSQKLKSRRTFAARRAKPLPWDALRRADPNFSRVIFQDFLLRLFTRTQLLRGEGDLETLRPYLAAAVLERRRAEQVTNQDRGRKVQDVIVGALIVERLEVEPDGATRATVAFEFNYAWQQKGQDGLDERYAREVWTLTRGPGAKSPSPEGAQKLGCPNCGAPVDLAADGKCAYCDTVIAPGTFSWAVTSIQSMIDQPRHQYNLQLSGGEEEGTELPDVTDPRAQQRLKELSSRGFAYPEFERFARKVFLELQAAWSEQSWTRARPYETDNLFQTHLFFIEAYRRRGLKNKLESPSVTSIRPVRVDLDRYYEAITLRIHARGMEYTEGPQGNLVAGSKTRARRFSEYWTFVRRAGVEQAQRAEAWDAEKCPSCGASLEVNQAGACEYCGTVVTSGEFTWVLAAIEQDEAYRG